MKKLAKLGDDGEHAPKRSHHKDAADKKPESASASLSFGVPGKAAGRALRAARPEPSSRPSGDSP